MIVYSGGGIWGPALGLLACGSVLVGSIIVGYFGGVFLDNKLGTKPHLMIVGVCIGSIGGFIEMYRIVKNLRLWLPLA